MGEPSHHSTGHWHLVHEVCKLTLELQDPFSNLNCRGGLFHIRGGTERTPVALGLGDHAVKRQLDPTRWLILQLAHVELPANMPCV